MVKPPGVEAVPSYTGNLSNVTAFFSSYAPQPTVINAPHSGYHPGERPVLLDQGRISQMGQNDISCGTAPKPP